MTARIRIRDDGGTLRTIIRIRMRDADGVLRTISRVRGRDTSGTLRTFFEGLTTTISPTTADGLYLGGGTSNVTTGSVLAVPSGGTSPYTYLWAATGTASPYTWTIGTSTAASTNFTAQSVPEGVVATQVFRVTVTDSVGTETTWDVFATARNNNTLQGGGTGEAYSTGNGPGALNGGFDVVSV